MEYGSADKDYKKSILSRLNLPQHNPEEIKERIDEIISLNAYRGRKRSVLHVLDEAAKLSQFEEYAEKLSTFYGINHPTSVHALMIAGGRHSDDLERLLPQAESVRRGMRSIEDFSWMLRDEHTASDYELIQSPGALHTELFLRGCLDELIETKKSSEQLYAKRIAGALKGAIPKPPNVRLPYFPNFPSLATMSEMPPDSPNPDITSNPENYDLDLGDWYAGDGGREGKREGDGAADEACDGKRESGAGSSKEKKGDGKGKKNGKCEKGGKPGDAEISKEQKGAGGGCAKCGDDSTYDLFDDDSWFSGVD